MISNPTVETTLKNDYAVYAVPKLMADWNMNRYASPTAGNMYTTEYDKVLFPISSICEANRPTGGIHKARVGSAIITDGYDSNVAPRFYLSDPDDVYKYWTSPEPTDGAGNFANAPDGGSKVRPYVIYGSTVRMNKIVIKMNIGWVEPKTYNVKLRRAGVWDTVAISTSPTISNNGVITLYYNGTAWSSTKPATMDNYVSADGVMLTVSALKGGRRLDGTPAFYIIGKDTQTPIYPTGSNEYFDLISIAAHYEADLSDRLIETSDTFDLGEASDLYPIGTITSNTANISLSNEDGLFNTESPTSIYKGLLEPDVRFTLSYIYTIGGSQYEIQRFAMYGGPWMGQRSATVTIDLEDHSKFLKTTFPRPSMWENLTMPEIVWRLCDSVGYTEFDITQDDRTTANKLNVYYVTGEKSVWEELDELATATQSAIYYNSYNRLQVKTRTAAFNELATPVWDFTATDLAGHLADIVSYNQDEEAGVNKMTVTYQPTKWATGSKNIPILERVWEPEGTVTLRASQLTVNLGSSDNFAWINKDDIKIWPWEGNFQVGGEIIGYKGKQYIYYLGANGDFRVVAIVKSEDEKTKFDNLTPNRFRYKNHFTGALAVTERGKWGSDVRTHQSDKQNYSVRTVINGTINNNATGLYWNRQESTISLHGSGRFKDDNDLMVATIGSTADSPFFVYGTKFKFERGKGYKGRRAGILINNQASEDGYFIDVTSSFKLDGKGRDLRNEVAIYTKIGGVYKKLSTGGKAAIQDEKWYQLDVFFQRTGGNHIITAYIDGMKVDTVTISGADKVATENGKFGMFIRGDTKATFEYLYALADESTTVPADDVTWFDMVTSGYTGDLWDREWVYGWKDYWSGGGQDRERRRARLNSRFFDDFGLYIHEVREYNVKFDPAPVQSSRMFNTNSWQSIVLEYRGSPFGGHWIVCNTSRDNAVLNGEDNLTFRQDSGGINQVMVVFGHALNFGDEETIVSTNDPGIQMRGKVEAELNSPWIQTKAMAKEIGDWMVKHWGIGVENASLEVFGNPLIELGDVITVSYPDYSFASTKFFVTGTATSFESGLKTTLTLRRVR